MPRPARAREPSRASPRRAAARTRTGCAAPRPPRSAGAAVQRGRPRLRRAAARASRSGPASGPAIGGAAAARAVDRRRRRPRSRVCLRCQRAWPRRAIPAARAATTRRGGCPGTRATASRMAIASMITRIGRVQTSVSATKLAALAPRHRPLPPPSRKTVRAARPPLAKVDALNAEPGDMTPLAHLAWAKALPVSVKPGQLPSALREAADERDRMSEREVEGGGPRTCARVAARFAAQLPACSVRNAAMALPPCAAALSAGPTEKEQCLEARSASRAGALPVAVSARGRCASDCAISSSRGRARSGAHRRRAPPW